MDKEIAWCFAPRCRPKECMHASVCPVIGKQKRLFRWTALALILVIAFCAYGQHYFRAEDMSTVFLPDHRDVYQSWYLSPDGALIYNPSSERTETVVSLNVVPEGSGNHG